MIFYNALVLFFSIYATDLICMDTIQNIKRKLCTPWYADDFIAAAQSNKVAHLRKLILNNFVEIETTDIDKKTALMHACQKGHYQASLLLIKNGANINSKDRSGTTPLLYAVAGNKKKIVKLLLRNPKLDVNAVDYQGPALHYTFNTLEERTDLIEQLAQHTQLDINKQNNVGFSALLWATILHRHQIMKTLLKLRANVNDQTCYGTTALHIAAEHNNLEAVRILLNHPQIDVHRKNYYGFTPLGAMLYAPTINNNARNQIAKELIEAGSDLNSLSHNYYSPLRIIAELGENHPLYIYVLDKFKKEQKNK